LLVVVVSVVHQVAALLLLMRGLHLAATGATMRRYPHQVRVLKDKEMRFSSGK
jgi:hypothetical protein